MVVYANAVFKVPVSNPGSNQMFVRVDFTVQARLSLKLVSVVCYVTVIADQVCDGNHCIQLTSSIRFCISKSK